MVTCATCGEDVKGKAHPPNCQGPARPLHVRVAEALGWVGLKHEFTYPDGAQRWSGFTSEEFREKRKGRPIQVPEYDTDTEYWGPLLSEYKFALRFYGPDEWCAYDDFDVIDGQIEYSKRAFGKTIGVAICELLCAVKGT